MPDKLVEPIPDPRIARYIAEISKPGIPFVSISPSLLFKAGMEHGYIVVEGLVNDYFEAWRQYREAYAALADEFLAVLDRTAAKVIAYSVQKAARRAGATVIVATTHTDMVDDLAPDLYIEKRFREKVLININGERA